MSRNFGAWGSANVTFFYDLIEDYVTVIPISGGGESSGNVPKASRRGYSVEGTWQMDSIGFAGAKLDLNHDGQIDDTEMIETWRCRFVRSDEDGESTGVPADSGDDGPADTSGTTTTAASESSSTGVHDDTSGPSQAEDGAIDRGCACRADRRRLDAPWWLVPLVLARRRFHSRRSAASSRTHGASAG